MVSVIVQLGLAVSSTLLIIVTGGLCVADEPAAGNTVTIEPVEQWSNVFADSRTQWTYRVSSKDLVAEPLHWALAIEQRLVSSGELALKNDAKPIVERTIDLHWPKLKPGVILAARLTVTVGKVSHERIISIFSDNPFVSRKEWLTKLKLKMFDPDGQTAALFVRQQIVHHRLPSREALNEVREGIIVIGEGVSLAKYGWLMSDLHQLAARGIPVLCLASSEGRFHWPVEKPAPSAMQWRRSDFILELDKRLDAKSWPKMSPQVVGLRCVPAVDHVLAEVSDDAASWPWCEWRFGDAQHCSTSMIWCGFGLVAGWDDGPAPRFLFARILERLNQRVFHFDPLNPDREDLR